MTKRPRFEVCGRGSAMSVFAGSRSGTSHVFSCTYRCESRFSKYVTRVFQSIEKESSAFER